MIHETFDMMRLVEENCGGRRHIKAARWVVGQIARRRRCSTGWGVVVALFDDVSSGDPDYSWVKQAYRIEDDAAPPTPEEIENGYVRILHRIED